MPAKEIKELRQSGKLEEAYAMAKAELEADLTNIWGKRNLSCVLYVQLDELTSNLDAFIAVHYRRGGRDDGRHIVLIDDYMKIIDSWVPSFLANGTAIKFVYFTGDNIAVNLNIANLTQLYPNRSYAFTMPNFLASEPNGIGEPADHVKYNTHLRQPLVAEFLFDMHMYFRSFGYLGVHSNLWTLLYPMRLGANKTNSCMFKTKMNPPFDLTCDEFDPEYWRMYFFLVNG
jgi:hypothetical protein